MEDIKHQSLEEQINSVANAKTDRTNKEQLARLIRIGFGRKKDYKPTVWKYANKVMQELEKSGVVVPHDYGKGKGKWDIADPVAKIDDVISKANKIDNPEIDKAISGYVNYMDRLKNDLGR